MRFNAEAYRKAFPKEDKKEEVEEKAVELPEDNEPEVEEQEETE